MEQLSIFDYMADNIPQMPLSQKIKYIGINKKNGFINGNTYKARYKIEKNDIQFIISIVTGTNRNGIEQGYCLIKFYKNISELLEDWDIPALEKWKGISLGVYT
jgi:hypothetical protein